MSQNETTKSDRKYKILVVPSDRTGVGYFRSTAPHVSLQENYPDLFHIDIDYQPNLDDENFLSQYDLIHYHRTLGPYEKMKELLDRLNRLGIKSIMDIDDYWSPGIHHPAHMLIKSRGIDKMILENIKNANIVTTTTNLFAEEISKYNKNVFVFPNAIDPNHKQFTPNPEPSERVRIGWLGGSSHKHDIQLLRGLSSQLYTDGLIDKIQFVLCGYDLRGIMTFIDPKTGEQNQRPIKPEESVWYEYEKIFTDDYRIVSPDYKKHLLKFSKEDDEKFTNEPYRRVWTKPISTYATNYNLFDISLAPLEENIFNKCKSQLKVIEAGFHKKLIIAQNFGPYKIDIKHAWNKGGEIGDGNGFLVNSDRNHKDWYKFLKKSILNPNIIKDLSESLHETVKSKYTISHVCESRKEFYIDLINGKYEKLKREDKKEYEYIP